MISTFKLILRNFLKKFMKKNHEII